MQDSKGKEVLRTSLRKTQRETDSIAYSDKAREMTDVKPKLTCPRNRQPMISRQAAVCGSPIHIAGCDTAPPQMANHKRSLSEIGRGTRIDGLHKNALSRRSRSVTIDLRDGISAARSLDRSSSYCTRQDQCEGERCKSSTVALTKSITKPISWLRRRWLFHQISDSALILDRSTSMHQDRKISRCSSEVDVDSKSTSPQSTIETRRAKHQKVGPHPKKKMLRSHSESAIDLNVIRANMKHSATTPADDEKPTGIICSNEDFMQILSESRRHKFGRRRNNTIIAQLESTPEIPTEAEIHLDNWLSEEHGVSGKRLVAALQDRKDGKEKVIKLPMRQCAGSDPNSPAHLSDYKREIVRLSPLMVHKNNVNNNTPIKSVHLSPKASMSSRLTRCDACPDELEPMLPKDNNGNNIIGKGQLVIEEQTELEQENIPSNNDIDNADTKVKSAFDAQLLGEAIERHLAMHCQTSPSRKSSRFGDGRRGRSGSLKNSWGQNNTQISTRIGNLISRFPFKKDGSVSPPNDNTGVTV